MISPLLRNLRTTLWSTLRWTSRNPRRIVTSGQEVRGTFVSDNSPAMVVLLATCFILADASGTVAQEARGLGSLSDSSSTEPPEFLTGPLSDAGQQSTARPQRSMKTAQTAAVESSRANSHVAGERQVANERVAPETWQEEYSGHVDDVLHGGTSRSRSGTVGDWWRQRLPYAEFVTVEPGRLKASAQEFIHDHTLPPEHEYDVDVYDQRPISVASSQSVTTDQPMAANTDAVQGAIDSGTDLLRTDIREIRPTLGYAMRNIDAGQLPEGFNEKLDQGDYVARQSSPAVLQWAPTNLYHYPLYFEDPALERYGHTYHPVVQPFASAGRFATQLVGLPYQMTLHPAHSREYALGYYRPGECAPKKHYQIPFNEEAALMQAAAMAGFFLIFP